MRQRVMIAMALACNPKIIIADEPTTALDVTVQAQIFDLLHEIKEKFSTSIILITHDFGVITEMADKVMVMYAGHKIEEGRLKDIVGDPKHPYTIGLNSMPEIKNDVNDLKNELPELAGNVLIYLIYTKDVFLVLDANGQNMNVQLCLSNLNLESIVKLNVGWQKLKILYANKQKR